jgi:protein TonB
LKQQEKVMVANLKLVANSTWHEESKATLDSVANKNNKNIDELSLNTASIFNAADETTPSYRMLAIVVAAHLVILAAILTSKPDVAVISKVITPMTVSLVNTPSADEQLLKPEVIPQQPEVIEIPKKQEQKVKQTRENTQQPAKELATTKPEVNVPVEQPVMAEAAVSENPIKAEQPAQVVEASAKIEAVAEPAIEPPRFGAAYLNNPAPTYPPVSRRFGEQGRVLLRVLVSENGLAQSVQLDSSSGFEKLDRAAIEAVKKWSFIPAKRSNQPVSAYVLVPVKFSLSS